MFAGSCIFHARVGQLPEAGGGGFAAGIDVAYEHAEALQSISF
jgi:hypothetical protein